MTIRVDGPMTNDEVINVRRDVEEGVYILHGILAYLEYHSLDKSSVNRKFQAQIYTGWSKSVKLKRKSF